MVQRGFDTGRTLWKEPLLHFAIIGAVVFGGYHWLNGNSKKNDRAEPIHIGEGDLRWLKQTWSSQWLRDPTDEELSGLVNDLVGEQLLAREAEAMGLGENDAIIRRRLAQKLKFVIEDTAQLTEPTDEELREYYASHAASFAAPGMVSFKQIYFNPEQRTAPAIDATTLLAEMKAMASPSHGGRRADHISAVSSSALSAP